MKEGVRNPRRPGHGRLRLVAFGGALLLACGASPARAANQPPVVQLGPDIGVLERDLGLLRFDGWAPVMLPGPSSESGQALTVQIDVLGGTYCDEHPALSLSECADAMFDIAPTVAPDTGTLEFATARNTDGTIRLRAVVRDDGGTGDGGVDTASADFTVTLNRREPTRTVSVRNPWRSPCVPVPMVVDGTGYNKDDYNARLTFELSSYGFLSGFAPVEYLDGGWLYRVLGSEAAPFQMTACWTSFSPTFTGTDSFTYRYDDGHGGDPIVGTVQIEIFED